MSRSTATSRAVRSVVGVVGLCLALVVGVGACGSSGGDSASTTAAPSISTPQRTIRAYAEALLHGTGDEFVSHWASTCTPAKKPVDLTPLQKRIEAFVGKPLNQVHVTGAKLKGRTATKAIAEATYDLPAKLAGDSNWIPLIRENGTWRVANCTYLPIGGNAQTKSQGSGKGSTPTTTVSTTAPATTTVP